MKKLHKLTKLFSILIAELFIFTVSTSHIVAGIEPTGSAPQPPSPPIIDFTLKGYAAFSISEGIETSSDSICALAEGIPGIGFRVVDFCSAIDIGNSQNTINDPYAATSRSFAQIALLYQSALGYQNAQCTADGIPKASSEIFDLSASESNPTQIICTAEKIPDEPEEPDEPDAPEDQNSSVDFNLNISEMLEITGLPSTIKLDIDSSNFDKLATTTLNLSTASNYAYGYIFTLLTDSTNLTDSTTSATIPTLASGTYTDANFTTNRWGFSLDSTNFRSIATTNTLYSTTAPSISTPTAITLGLKLDATQPAGTYSTILNFALTPNIVTE